MKQSGTVYISGNPMQDDPIIPKNAPKVITQQAPTTKAQHEKKIERLATQSSRKLLEISSVFPFQLFPDHLMIDENKITISYGLFFYTRQVFTTFISDIKTVELVRGLFFAQLRFEIIGYKTNPPVIDYLRKKDAIKAKRLILGLIALHSEKVDVSRFSIEEIIGKIEEIGHGHTLSIA